MPRRSVQPFCRKAACLPEILHAGLTVVIGDGSVCLVYLFQERVILVSWQMVKRVQPLALGQHILETRRSVLYILPNCNWLIVH